MATELVLKAKDAFMDDNYELAVELYGLALADPNADLYAGGAHGLADLYADRAQVYIKLESYTEAVADANRAIELDPSMTKAYLRKGTACIKLKEYQNAKTALETGASLAPTDSRFTKLIKECDKANWAIEPSNKLKFWYYLYDTPTEVVLSIYPKDVPLDNVAVDFREEFLAIRIVDDKADEHCFTTQLFAKIDMDKSTYEVLPPKVEVHLAKAESIFWTSLEDNETAFHKKLTKLKEETVNLPKLMQNADGSLFLSYPPKEKKCRYDYYNTPTEVVLTIYPEDIPFENVGIGFNEDSFLFSAIDADGEQYRFFTELFAKFDMDKCSYDDLETKVVIRIAKAESIFWTSLFPNEGKLPEKIMTLTATNININREWEWDLSEPEMETVEGMKAKRKGKAKNKKNKKKKGSKK